MDVLILLLRLLLRLEEASADTAGILPISLRANGGPYVSTGEGMIMAEGGRVCWASSPRSPHRLSDILMSISGISKAQIEKVFQFCRKTGQPLGEHMVSLGILTREQLREALLQHSTAALLRLGHLIQGGVAVPEHFQVNKERSYSPMFRFSGLELAVEMIRREPELGVALGRPPESFQRWGPKAQNAVCFRETGREDIPGVPIGCFCQGLDLTLREAMEIFHAGRELAEPAALLSADIHPFSTVVRNQKRAWLTSHTSPHLCVYQVEKPALLGSILSGVLKESQLEPGRDR
jgi:hypothetical protein